MGANAKAAIRGRKGAAAKPSETSVALAWAVEAFAAREGFPKEFRRLAASLVATAPVTLAIGDEKIREILSRAIGSDSAWRAMGGTGDGDGDGIKLRCCIHGCLFRAKRAYDGRYSVECREWSRRIREWSREIELLRDGEGNLLNEDVGISPPPEFSWINKLRRDLSVDPISRFPSALMNHPQLFGAKSMSEFGGMI